jgi:phosphoribosylformylglycinamidine synthase
MNPNFGKIDPYWMAASSIDEAVRNNVAVGGRRLAILDNFSWGNPERPERLGSLVKACEACRDIATSFGTPFISGKDSLYNESPLGPVTPTLLITALGVIPDIRLAISLDVKSPNNLIFIVGETTKELGGSEYYKTKGFLGKTVPKVQAETARRTFEAVTETIDAGLVKACHDLSEGGLAVAAAEMAFSGDYGMELDLRRVPCTSDLHRDDFVLFSESNSRFLIEVSPKAKGRFETLVEGIVHAEVGKVLKSRRLPVVGQSGKVVLDASLNDLLTSWRQTLGSEG